MFPVDAGRDGPEENGTDIMRQVEDVLNRLHFAEESIRVPLRVLIRKHMVESIGPEWAKCTMIAHTLPNGEQVYTVSRLCIACGKVHTFVLCRDGEGDFYIAAPSPVRRDDY